MVNRAPHLEGWADDEEGRKAMATALTPEELIRRTELQEKHLPMLAAQVPADGKTKEGYNLIDGTLPIRYMKDMMNDGLLPQDLIDRVTAVDWKYTQLTDKEFKEGEKQIFLKRDREMDEIERKEQEGIQKRVADCFV
jgi:hypothetical protein